MNRRVSHIRTHAYPLLIGRPEIRGGYASWSRYIGYTQPVLPPPQPRSVQSNFMICIHLASRAPDLPLVVPVIVLFSRCFFARPPLRFYRVLYRKKGEWLRKSITSIHVPSVFNSLIVPTFASHWSLPMRKSTYKYSSLIYIKYRSCYQPLDL